MMSKNLCQIACGLFIGFTAISVLRDQQYIDSVAFGLTSFMFYVFSIHFDNLSAKEVM